MIRLPGVATPDPLWDKGGGIINSTGPSFSSNYPNMSHILAAEIAAITISRSKISFPLYAETQSARMLIGSRE